MCEVRERIIVWRQIREYSISTTDTRTQRQADVLEVLST